MIRAVWDGAVVAEAARTVRVEGNHYFPPRLPQPRVLHRQPDHVPVLGKGLARYYRSANPDAAGYYPKPSPLARRIMNHVAFWQGVRIEADADHSEFHTGSGR
ncbi:hypothetical protein FMUBM48_14520 [Nocardia cyriacigeorgica]|nr:hypothetical protein FMUBM48_14520 [Nocardia cyriacigeorgica]